MLEKSSHLPPAVSSFCSHLALDFVTGLPPSQGDTVIFTVVDRFSKAVYYVALSKLPTACETTDLFVSALGASVSLTSGFHPQTNGQTERVNQDLVPAALLCNRWIADHHRTFSQFQNQHLTLTFSRLSYSFISHILKRRD
ncbi:hypothetical protein PAMP_019432 [Pampus punctatissimus]